MENTGIFTHIFVSSEKEKDGMMISSTTIKKHKITQMFYKRNAVISHTDCLTFREHQTLSVKIWFPIWIKLTQIVAKLLFQWNKNTRCAEINQLISFNKLFLVHPFKIIPIHIYPHAQYGDNRF